jgi:DNA-3-methyladenine glycosylase
VILAESFYKRATERVAKDLVGKRLVRTMAVGGRQVRLAGIIVETEAYGHGNDPASHAHGGQTARNAVMFGQVGRAYVYFTYGSHYCVNVSARSQSAPAGAVLIRGIEPVEGTEAMRKFRNTDDIHMLASGPGRLTQAMCITRSHNGLDMTAGSGLWIEQGEKREVVATPRIGISKAVDWNWRFVDPASRFASRKMRSSS